MSTVRIQVRRGTASQWTSANPTLAAGEVGLESDTSRLKFGDGSTAWTSLAYATTSSAALSNTLADYVLVADIGQPDGVASLNSSGKIPTSQLPDALSFDSELTAAINALTTSDIEEGTNLYFTAERAQDAIAGSLQAGSGNVTVSYNDNAGTITLNTGSDISITGDFGADTVTANTVTVDTQLNAADVNITGDLTIGGTTTTVNSTNLTVTDPLIYIGENNNANVVDLGLVSSFNDGTYQHSGLVKDATDGIWKLFRGVTDEPTTTVNFAQASYETLKLGGLVANTASIGDVSNVELQYLNGVTSAVQTQIDSKAPSAGPTITGNAVFTGTVTLPNDTVGEPVILDAAVTTGKIQNSAITDVKLASNSVTTAKVADYAVTAIKIDTAAVTEAKLAETSVTTDKIAGAAVTADKLASNAVTTIKILDENITEAKLGPDSVTTIKIADSAVTNEKISDTTISGAKLAGDSVSTAKVVDLAITTQKINDAAVNVTKIANSAVETAKIADAAVTNVKLAGSIDQSKVTNLVSDLADKAPLNSPTFTGTVTLPANTISQSMMGDDSVGTNEIGGLAVTNEKLAGSIGWDKLAISSTVSSTEAGYLDGVTSAIQTQLNEKLNSSTASSTYAPIASPTLTGTTTTDDLVVDGDLTVNGTNFAASATSITIEDNMVQLAHQNAANTVDLGIVVGYNDGTAKHSGIVRDVSDSKWKLFKGVTTEPSTTVDFTQGSLDDLALNNLTAAGIIFTDGTQTKEGVPSRTEIVTKSANFSITDGNYRDDMIEVTSAATVTVTADGTNGITYPVGTSIDILQTTSGQVTIAYSGATVNATPGLKLRAQWSSATLFKRAANTWVLLGDLSA